MNLRPLLSASLVAALAILSALSAEASIPRDCYQSVPGYQLQMFRDQEAQMLQWNSIYQQSPSGSAREREADIKRKAHARAAIETIQIPGALLQYPHAQIDAFASEMQSKYNQAQSGSFIESTYLSARNLSLDAYLQKGIENLNCETLDLNSTIAAASTYQSLYNQSQSGSRRESIFLQLRNAAYTQADIRVEQVLRYHGLNFRQLEAMGADYQSRYNQAQSGSRAETFYRRARDIAYESALATFQSSIYQIQSYELSSLEREYHSRYNQAQSGSRLESYARQIRDLARAELARRGGVNPAPVPVPVPVPTPYCPDPNTHWDARLQRCVANSPLPQPPEVCPDPNTRWDPRLQRCVSVFN